VALMMKRGEIELPYGGDHRTRYWIDELIRQCKTWRPRLRGNKHRQDLLMALWFGWILWRERGASHNDPQQTEHEFQFQGLPWSPTGAGLLVPGGKR
jgi:hypothetical protein